MNDLEKKMSDKRTEVEDLKREMREANLEALAITPSEEIRAIVDGKYLS